VNERASFQIRVEGFNIFNHTNLYQPQNQLVSPTFGLSPNAFFPRQIQFAMKFIF